MHTLSPEEVNLCDRLVDALTVGTGREVVALTMERATRIADQLDDVDLLRSLVETCEQAFRPDAPDAVTHRLTAERFGRSIAW